MLWQPAITRPNTAVAPIVSTDVLGNLRVDGLPICVDRIFVHRFAGRVEDGPRFQIAPSILCCLVSWHCGNGKFLESHSKADRKNPTTAR